MTTNNKDAQQFYDDQRGWTIQSRRNLKTYNLRQFNNWVKDVLITKYCKERTQQLKISQDLKKVKLRVLEIGCGKGGDVQKWSHESNNVNLWYGVDIAGNSLEEAKKRIQNLKNQQFFARLIREYGNSDSETFFKNFHPETKFDLISSQFVIHYMFDSEQSVRNLAKNMTSRLTKNGYIILTIPDANVIVKMLKELADKIEVNGETQYRYLNSYFGLQTSSLDFPKDRVHGVEYGFYLADAVGEQKDGQTTFVPEYLIYLDKFIEIMKEEHMQVVENDNFLDFYDKEKQNYLEQLLFRFKHFTQKEDQIEDDLWDCIHCYRVLVFRKQQGREQSQTAREKDIYQHKEERVKYVQQTIQEKQQFYLNKDKKPQQLAQQDNKQPKKSQNDIFSDSEDDELKEQTNIKASQYQVSDNQTTLLKAEIASILQQEKNAKLQNSQQKEKNHSDVENQKVQKNNQDVDKNNKILQNVNNLPTQQQNKNTQNQQAEIKQHINQNNSQQIGITSSKQNEANHQQKQFEVIQQKQNDDDDDDEEEDDDDFTDEDQDY